MTENSGPFTDTDLHAYIDGEMDEARSRGLEEHLRSDSEMAAKLSAYQAQIAELHRAFDDILDEPLPDRLTSASQYRRPGWIRPISRIAAALVLLIAGGAMGWFARGPNVAANATLNDFTRHAASAHRIYVAERRHAVEVAAKEEKHLVRWLSKRLGHELRVPVLLSQGFELVGGRQLASPDNAPAAQFMYQDAQLRRLTLYVRSSIANERTSFRFARGEGAMMFYWIDDPFSYALAGQIEKDELLKISRIVAEQISP